MTSSFFLPRKLLILSLVLPLAAFLGYLLATPDSFTTWSVVGMVVLGLLVPVLMRWHHALLVVSWNAAVQVFFLPGQPQLWMLLAGVSLMFGILNRLLLKQESQAYVPSVVWPLIFLTLVVVVTAKLTGGIGVRALGGSAYGGKRYYYFLAAVIGYFALTGQRVPASKVGLYMGLFLLSYLTAAVGDLLYVLGPDFWFLYAVFPVGGAMYQAVAEFTGSQLVRVAGLTLTGTGVCQFLLCRFGVRGLLMVDKPWRLAAFFLALAAMLLGGFRSALFALGVLFALTFFLEGLHRTRLVIAVLIALVIGGAVVVPFAQRLPLSMQRALAFLPIPVDPQARDDALDSTEWRVKMWKVLWPDVPKYLLLGKGGAISPTDLYLAQESMKRGLAPEYEVSLLAGDYHSGPLSLLVQFGLWGVVGFLWFCIASLRFLYAHYQRSPPELMLCNRFLLALFITQVLCFFVTFGSFADHFYIFTGIVGLSVSLNGRLKTEPDDQDVPVAG